MADRDARKAELDRKKAKLAQMKADKQRREVGFGYIFFVLVENFQSARKERKEKFKEFFKRTFSRVKFLKL